MFIDNITKLLSMYKKKMINFKNDTNFQKTFNTIMTVISSSWEC